MLILEFFSKRFSSVMSLSVFKFALVSILILLLICTELLSPNKTLPNKLSPDKLLLALVSLKLSKYFNIDFQCANFCYQAGINIDISKSL